MTDQEKIEYYENILYEIGKISQNIPPFYSYGDNEAACYMADLLNSISEIIPDTDWL